MHSRNISWPFSLGGREVLREAVGLWERLRPRQAGPQGCAGWPLPPCVELGRTAGRGEQGRAGRPPRGGSRLSGHTSGVLFSVPVPSPARRGYRQWLWAAGVLGCPALAVAPSLPLPSQRPGGVGCSTEAGVPGPIRPQAVAPAGDGRRAHTCSHAHEAHTPRHAGGTRQSVPLGPRPAGCSFLGLVLQADPIRSRHRASLFQNSRRKLESRTFSPTCDQSVPAVGAGRSERRSGCPCAAPASAPAGSVGQGRADLTAQRGKGAERPRGEVGGRCGC